MEKILQSKTFLVFGLLLICALFVMTYKSVPLQQNEVFVQPIEVDEVSKSQNRILTFLNQSLPHSTLQPNNTYWANMTHLNTTSKWCNGHLRFLDPPGHSIYIKTVSS